jgi:ABC-type glutathione transport system ATPase component
MTALRLHDLRVAAPGTKAPLLDGLDLTVDRGETVALLGRSGAGKSLTIRSVLGLNPPGWSTTGEISIDGARIDEATAEQRRTVRLRSLSIVLQDPRAAFNPVRTIGDFVTEAALERGAYRSSALAQAATLLDEVGLPDPQRLLTQFPHELSGGMLQRVAIAAALSGQPALVIADEPTASLDVLTQADVVATLLRAQARHGFGLLFVTHDLSLAQAVADRVVVLDGGRIVEDLPAAELAASAREPATRALLDAAEAITLQKPPEPAAPGDPAEPPVLVVDELSRTFGEHRALDGVSLSIRRGATLALVGGSGSGKSTLARIVAGLDVATAGTVSLGGPAEPRGRRDRARRVQMVFQDPALSLDPRLTAQAAIERALGAAGVPRRQRPARAAELLGTVGLDATTARRRPRELSGGQCQRVSIARALAFGADLLVLDEATSALDPEVRGQVLALLEELRDRLGLAMLVITHDLGVVSRLADEIVVLHRGRVVESGRAADVIAAPQADYTRLLLDALPHRGWQPEDLARRRRALDGGGRDEGLSGGAQRTAGDLESGRVGVA